MEPRPGMCGKGVLTTTLKLKEKNKKRDSLEDLHLGGTIIFDYILK